MLRDGKQHYRRDAGGLRLARSAARQLFPHAQFFVPSLSPSLNRLVFFSVDDLLIALARMPCRLYKRLGGRMRHWIRWTRSVCGAGVVVVVVVVLMVERIAGSLRFRLVDAMQKSIVGEEMCCNHSASYLLARFAAGG